MLMRAAILLFSPYWTPIADMIRGAEARPVYVPTSAARRSGITAALEKLTTPETRAIYYNTPQNPSGVVFTRAEAEEVAAFAQRHDLIVIADEAYEDLVYDGEHVSLRIAAGDGGAHYLGLYLLQELRDDGLAHRLRGRA